VRAGVTRAQYVNDRLRGMPPFGGLPIRPRQRGARLYVQVSIPGESGGVSQRLRARAGARGMRGDRENTGWEKTG
jgi:hypothetical protein